MMRLSNLESILSTSQEHAKQQDKENKRLQFGELLFAYISIAPDPDFPRPTELDSRSQTGESTNRMAEINSALEAQIKSLQSDLQRVQSAKESLQNELNAASAGGVMGNMGNSGGGERTKILNLENQVEGLRKENMRLMEETRKVGVELRCSSGFVPDRTSRRPWTRTTPPDQAVQRSSLLKRLAPAGSAPCPLRATTACTISSRKSTSCAPSSSPTRRCTSLRT